MSQVTESSIKDLRDKIESIRFGMLTTLNHDQSLSSRPMTQQHLDDNGVLWFFIADDSQLAHDIISHAKINVTFANPADDIYVTVSGDADVVKNRQKAAELWNPAVSVWFPRGLDDPHLGLVKFTIHCAEYWDVHTNKMKRLFAMAKAAIVGEPPKDISRHEKIDF